jgi:hypothetical protein
MLRSPLVPIAALFALLALAAPTVAQQPADCPAVEDGTGTPVELRIGDFVLRAQVTSDAGVTGEGTRVEGRLVGCERDARIPAPADDADAVEPRANGLGSMLRLLHDLRIGLEMGPAEEGSCMRARLEITDAAGGLVGTAGERPVALELCGLPFTRDGGAAGTP